MLDFTLSAEQEAFAGSISSVLARRSGAEHTRPGAAWRDVADLGVLRLGAGDDAGDAVDLVVAMRAIGAMGVGGPFLGAMLAREVVDGALLEPILDGRQICAVVENGIAAWGALCDVTIEVHGDGSVSRVEIESAVPLATLAGEPWARVTTRSLDQPDRRDGALAMVELARAAWLVGAGEQLVRLAADHARDRHQFGRAIGDFQAVAHPLAEAAADVGAALDLAFVAAARLRDGGERAPVAAARLAATAAGLKAAYASHQAHGALGYTAERGLDRWSAGIRQLSVHPPGRRIVEAWLVPGPVVVTS